MYKKRRTLKSFLTTGADSSLSRETMNTIIRSLLEPVVNQNTASFILHRLKNKDGLDGLIKRLEYCANINMVDVLNPGILIRDDYVELEFIILNSSRYNFALIWDYSKDSEKSRTEAFFLINSGGVNEVFETLQANMNADFREDFYKYKPERRENGLLNEAVFNVITKLNNSIEENAYRAEDDLVIDLSDEDDIDSKIKKTSHEIKNLLSVVDINLKLIEKKPEEKKYLDTVRKSLSLISFQLNELKSYENSAIKELSVEETLKTANFLFEEPLKENNNKILIEPIRRNIKVFADEHKLLSVITNIIKNANEHTKNDTVSIKTAQNGACTIEITNHGAKIEDKERIFNKGFTTKQKGEGIGLWASKAYIESLGGKLELVKSDEAETTFKITLPAAV